MSRRVAQKKGSLPAVRQDRARAVGPAARTISEFQPDALALEERVPPRVTRLALYGVTGLLIAAIAWASLSSVDEVVVAPGRLVTTKPTIVVQPLETSIVRSIDVVPGDVVKAGQKLARLDPTFTEADMAQQKGKLAALDAQVARMEAELAGRDYTAGIDNTADERLQAKLFGQRRAFYAAQLQNFGQQIAGLGASIASNARQQIILADRRTALVQIEGAREQLYENRTGSLLNFLTSKDERLAVDASLAQMEGQVAEQRHAVAKLAADRQAFIEDFRRATMEKLVEARGLRDTAREELKKMELRRARVALTAPEDAVVLDLAQRSIGSVVREAEPIVTLVPLDAPLEAEVSISTRDIGRVAAGDEARIKFDAFPFQKFGTADGTLSTISHDVLPANENDTSGVPNPPVFKARIPLGATKLRGLSEPVRLLPGMTVIAEVKVGRRRVISYFLYPLLRGLDESIREP
jgi:HlyD family secretion protein